ncbi:MAG: hypothetical protein Q9216_006665, partial [Gyalolechia sp. 2 TL-2023]
MSLFPECSTSSFKRAKLSVYKHSRSPGLLPQAQQLEVSFETNWETTVDDHESQAQRYSSHLTDGSAPSAIVELGTQEVFPYFNLFREAASFLESKPHASLEAMAFEASQLAFFGDQKSDGSRRLRNFRIGAARSSRGATKTLKKSWTFTAESFNRFQRARNDQESSDGSHQVLLALGSNVGNRISMIEQACVEMSRRGLKILKTSSLYETEPMYKTDQSPFINGVCQIETTLAPLELLDQLKSIENQLGRVKTVENGPRTIDLDILLYGNQTVDHERLQIPHPRISERDFVLKPLC